MPALASALIKIFIQWLMISQDPKETVESYASRLCLVSQWMEKAGYKFEEVIQSLCLLWGLDILCLGPIYESFFMDGNNFQSLRAVTRFARVDSDLGRATTGLGTRCSARRTSLMSPYAASSTLARPGAFSTMGLDATVLGGNAQSSVNMGSR